MKRRYDMRFSLKYLARRLYIKRHRFWNTYMSDEVQSKRADDTIINFPILSPADIDYEYVYAYVKDWVTKKYTDDLDIMINKIGNDDYYCETKRGSLMNNILDRIHEDYKEIFLGNLEKRVVDKNPEVVIKGSGDVGSLETEEASEGKLQAKQVKTAKKAKSASP
ncbi:BBG30-like protein (plasmid) [Borrelia hermsii HS1]|nr:BBG30-like protein [Borrelia hermsii HS1]